MNDIDLAGSLVREAGSLALRMRGAGLAADAKTSVSDIVTAADRAAEELVTGRLREARPDDSILGEEGAAYDGSSARRWVIDPVDGTYNFFHGLTWWCSALALADRSDRPGQPDRPVLGAVYNPHDQVTWLGGPDRPTTRNGVPVGVKDDLPLDRVAAATYLHPTWYDVPAVRDPWIRAASRPAALRMLGSGSMDLAAVADGRVGVWFQHTVPAWDWLPGAALVLGAGGAVAQVEVDEVVWSVAGGPRAVRDLVAALGG